MAEHELPALFAISFSMPPNQEKYPNRTYWSNHTVSILAMTIERAIELLRKAYPQGELHSVQRRSRGEVICDPELIKDADE